MNDQFKKILDAKIKQVTDTILKDKGFKEEIAKELVERIKRRTTEGYGVDEQGAAKRKFNALSPSYVEYRKKNKSKLGPGATVNKSNLHFTSEMVNSLHYQLNGDKIDIKVTSENQEKADWAVKLGRPWLSLSNLDVTKIKSKIKEKVKEILAKLNQGK